MLCHALGKGVGEGGEWCPGERYRILFEQWQKRDGEGGGGGNEGMMSRKLVKLA